jgi:hypothetical protein
MSEMGGRQPTQKQIDLLAAESAAMTAAQDAALMNAPDANALYEAWKAARAARLAADAEGDG